MTASVEIVPFVWQHIAQVNYQINTVSIFDMRPDCLIIVGHRIEVDGTTGLQLSLGVGTTKRSTSGWISRSSWSSRSNWNLRNLFNQKTGKRSRKRIIKIGFWGTGPKNLYGNIYFGQIARWMGVPTENLYVQNAGIRALRDFFAKIDLNRNRKLSADEVKLLEVEVCGYSWGAIAAIGFCQRLSTTGTKIVGGSPKSPIQFELGAPVRIKTLLVVDPVPIFNSPGVVPSTVDTFINYFQQNGGDGIMRASANRESVIRKMGTALSRQLRGMHIESKAVKSKQFDIGARQMSVNDGVRFANGSETNHDTIAWFVAATLAKRGADTDVV